MIVKKAISYRDNRVQIVNKEDDVNSMYGWSIYKITSKEIEEIKNGKCIYVADDEYATIIYLEDQ